MDKFVLLQSHYSTARQQHILITQNKCMHLVQDKNTSLYVICCFSLVIYVDCRVGKDIAIVYFCVVPQFVWFILTPVRRWKPMFVADVCK